MNKVPVAILAAALAIAVSAWILWPKQATNAPEQAETPLATKPVPALSIHEPASAKRTSPKSAAPAKLTDPLPEPVKQQFATIQRAYAEQIRYPGYSRPLSKGNWMALHPFGFEPISLPLDSEGKLRARLSMEKFQFFRPQPIRFSLQIDGLDEEIPAAEASLSKTGELTPLHRLTLTPTAGGRQQTGMIDSEQIDDDWPEELWLTVKVALPRGA